MARAAEVYARRQKLGDDAVKYAHAIKIEAMTLLGEFLKRAEKNKGAKGKKLRADRRRHLNRATNDR